MDELRKRGKKQSVKNATQPTRFDKAERVKEKEAPKSAKPQVPSSRDAREDFLYGG